MLEGERLAAQKVPGRHCPKVTNKEIAIRAYGSNSGRSDSTNTERVRLSLRFYELCTNKRYEKYELHRLKSSATDVRRGWKVLRELCERKLKEERSR